MKYRNCDGRGCKVLMENLEIIPFYYKNMKYMSQTEYEKAETLAVKKGEVEDPIVLWGKYVICGYTSYLICKKYPKVKYVIDRKEFMDEYDATAWIGKKLIGRNDIGERQKYLIIGECYEAIEKGSKWKNENLDEEYIKQLKQWRKKGEWHYTETAYKTGMELGIHYAKAYICNGVLKGVRHADEIINGFAEKYILGEFRIRREDAVKLKKYNREELESLIKSNYWSGCKISSSVDKIRNISKKDVNDIENITRQIGFITKTMENSLISVISLNEDVVNANKKIVLREIENAEKNVKNIIKEFNLK